METGWRMNNEQYQKLLSYIGCGNFPEADIIFFGNEEGTGGNTVEANVEARCQYYGRDEDENYLNCIDREDWTKGFWEPSASKGAAKVNKYLNEHGKEVNENDFTKGTFLPTIARMCLAIEGNESIDYWFPKDGDEKAGARDIIKSYIVESLFEPKEGVQTALADWRPLPRPNEGWWGKEYWNIYHDASNRNPYLKAFNQKNMRNECSNHFSDYKIDAEVRSNILQNAFTTFPAKIIIGLGGVEYKRGIFEKIFPGIEFLEIPGLEEITDMKNFKGEITINHKTVHIFLLPYPGTGYGFDNNINMYKFFSRVIEEHINPIVSKGKNVETDLQMAYNLASKSENEMISDSFRFIESKEAIEICRAIMIRTLNNHTDSVKETEYVKGYNLNVKYPALDFGISCSHVDQKWWNRLWFEDPQENGNVYCEFNIGFEGLRQQACFAEREGQLFLLHRGTKVAGMNIIERYPEEDTMIIRGAKRIVIGEITSNHFPIQIAKFIGNVRRLRD
ncbi:hypothetical protein JI666_14030 [Bacillus sp. NTK071]|uniref:hypothetical protein n=1 Tax=Bacillus sp. NTK071 TaxID=2802175 RepID=UPI001A8DAB96|nr:hypothetical protein [Bacillus sp. NTK071]MBN8209870.1 hypothetical protein [Bacillus sp. NTK071]